MKKQKVDSYTEKEILNGKSHQEIYNHIISTSEFNIHDVAEIVRKIPTLGKRKKYKTLNHILLLIIGLAIVDRIILTFNQMSVTGQINIGIILLFPIISIVLFYVVYKFKRNAHLSAGFLFVFGSLASIIRVVTKPEIFSVLNVSITFLGSFIAFYLSVKLVSDYTIDKEQQKNNPTQRENLITFTD